MSALDLATATCATALGITRAEFGSRVGEARKADYRGLEAIAVAFLAISDPDWGRRSNAGRKAVDAVAAAIWRGSPSRVRDSESRLKSVIAAAGGQWRNGPPPKKRKSKPARSLTAAALNDAAHALHPGRKSWDREVRRRIRGALKSGQMGFDGAGWGAET